MEKIESKELKKNLASAHFTVETPVMQKLMQAKKEGFFMEGSVSIVSSIEQEQKVMHATVDKDLKEKLLVNGKMKELKQ